MRVSTSQACNSWIIIFTFLYAHYSIVVNTASGIEYGHLSSKQLVSKSNGYAPSIYKLLKVGP